MGELLQQGFIPAAEIHWNTPARIRDWVRPCSVGVLFWIAVIDPRPTLVAGQAYIAQFDVDDPIPTVDIPLNAGEFLQFNFNVLYKKTLEETLYAWQLVDYSQAPLCFDRYSLADQTRIANRMLTVLKAASLNPLKPLSFSNRLLLIGKQAPLSGRIAVALRTRIFAVRKFAFSNRAKYWSRDALNARISVVAACVVAPFRWRDKTLRTNTGNKKRPPHIKVAAALSHQQNAV